MVTKLIMACILSATLLSCNGQNTNTINYATVEPLHINRFDKDLFRLIDTGFAAAAAVLRVAGAVVVGGAFLVFVVVLIFHFYSPFKIESAR